MALATFSPPLRCGIADPAIKLRNGINPGTAMVLAVGDDTEGRTSFLTALRDGSTLWLDRSQVEFRGHFLRPVHPISFQEVTAP